MKLKLEICCYSVESAIKAERATANRIELCDNYSEGGTTPSYAAIKLALEKIAIPINVIIRPRGGDFVYSDLEFESIKQDVLMCKKMGTNGVVVGFLNTDGSIDIEKTKQIIELAKPMEITFHRAFDMCNNHKLALEQLIEIGVDRVLTSGGMNKAEQGADLLAELVELADNRIVIMPGSGVNERNMAELITKTKATEFHSSAKMFEPSKMKYFNKNISMGGESDVDEFSTITVNENSIKLMVEILNK